MTDRSTLLPCGSWGIMIALLATAVACAQPAEETARPAIVLKATGLPMGDEPEAILPSGAVVHVRLKSSQLLLDDASLLAKSFVPTTALPPALQSALQEPNALLAFIGLQTVGSPLSVEALGRLSGIDPARPITLSLYQGPPNQAFILFLPMQDLSAISALLSRIVGTTPPEEIALPGGSAIRVNYEGRDLLLVCSQKAVCVCGSERLAAALLAAPRSERLDRSKFVAKVLAQHPKENLVVLLDAKPIKPFLPALKPYTAIPDESIALLRAQMLAEIAPQDLTNLNMQLRRRWGVRDVEQLLDYFECLGTGAYEVVAESLFEQAEDFEGLCFTVDVSADFQRLHMSVYSQQITAANARRPLPLAEVAPALRQMPGSHNMLIIEGQSAPAAKSQFLLKLLDRIGAKMDDKGLPKNLHATLQQAYQHHQPIEDLGSQVPWTVTTKTRIPASDAPQESEDLQSYFAALSGRTPTKLVAIPRQENGFLKSFFQRQAEINNANYQISRGMLEAFGAGPQSYTWESRAFSKTLPGDVTRFVQESSYTTQWGLFGSDEHELINRNFTLARDFGDLTLLWHGGKNPEFMAQFKPQPIPVAVKRLLSESGVPADANRIEVLRVLQMINDVADVLDEMEQLVHKDVAKYLTEVDALRNASEDRELMVQLGELKMPPEIFELKVNSQGEFYATSPVMLTFPRPRIMPELLDVLKDFREAADAQGGMIAFERTRDGQYEITVVQSTEALATLVRTVGDNIMRRYVQDPAGKTKLQALFRTPLDAETVNHPQVLINPTWEFLPGTYRPSSEN